MPLIQINVEDGRLSDPTGTDHAAALPKARPDHPVVIMIHGRRFDPGDPAHDPHTHILSLNPSRGGSRAVSWPRRLGARDDGRVTAIAFGWNGLGTLRSANRQAEAAGRALAGLIGQLHAAGHRPHLFAHSLGARVALTALRLAPPGSIGRVILVAAAATRTDATAALASPAAEDAQILNIVSRENRLFDLLFRIAVQRGPTLGRGLGQTRSGWFDMALDDARHLSALASIGFRLGPPRRRICHWSGYLRPGIFRLYRAFLTDRAPLPLSHLREALAPARPSPILVSTDIDNRKHPPCPTRSSFTTGPHPMASKSPSRSKKWAFPTRSSWWTSARESSSTPIS